MALGIWYTVGIIMLIYMCTIYIIFMYTRSLYNVERLQFAHLANIFLNFTVSLVLFGTVFRESFAGVIAGIIFLVAFTIYPYFFYQVTRRFNSSFRLSQQMKATGVN